MVANSNDLSDFRESLLAWYARHGRRDLPWRNTRDPYFIYVSEIMLQQTQVKTVRERYYAPFLQRFPSLASVATAPLEEVLKCWQGLGYYTRAGNLHRAAKACGGVLPDNLEGLRALPGVGRNTAQAVACFGFGIPVPVMEANLKRVISRLFLLEAPKEETLWEKAAQLLDPVHSFDYNQAMMDIGALVCLPKAPLCPLCPLKAWCRGSHDPERYPAPKAKKPPPLRRKRIAVFQNDEGKIYLAARATRLLGGLYGFPEYEEEAETVRFLGEEYRFEAPRLLGEARHTYTHFRLLARVYRFRLKNAALPQEAPWQAYSLKEARLLPLSRVDLLILRLLEKTP